MADDWKQIAERLGKSCAQRAAQYDRADGFVAENYAELKANRVFSLLVPSELGGGGGTFTQLCEFLHELGRHCASTALALAMHQHLVAATVFRHLRGQPGAKLLERIAKEQLVLVSTGATDWVDSNGQAKRVPGGYRVSARKVFGSGCPVADLLLTTFAADDEPEGPSVIHCPVSLKGEGVQRLTDWQTLGMRGTGSHTITLEDVFVPDEAVALKRPKGKWHPAWDVTLGVAPPIYMAAYAGLASAAAEQALAYARASQKVCTSRVLAAGRLQNANTEVQLLWRDMVRLGAELAFTPSLENSSAQLVRKTLMTRAVEATMEAAMAVVGGAGFYRALPFERMWRDAQAAHYHPLPEDRQLLFSGRVALGLDGAWQD